MKAVYVQEGKNLDYQNTGSTVIAAGEVVVPFAWRACSG